jgi:hypothetical protein
MLRRRLKGRVVRVEFKQVQAREAKGTIGSTERLVTIYAHIKKML